MSAPGVRIVRPPWRAPHAFLLLAALAVAGCGRVPKLVVPVDPLSADEHVALGVAYERKGDLALAAREYGRALRKDPSSYPARFNLGNVRLAEMRCEEARREYLGALALRPGEPEAANNLSWAAICLGEGREDALRLLEGALSDPARRSPPFLDTLGVLLGELGRAADGEKVFAEALARCEAGDPACTESVRSDLREHLEALRARRPFRAAPVPAGN